MRLGQKFVRRDCAVQKEVGEREGEKGKGMVWEKEKNEKMGEVEGA
jgi:hypothetical protein